MARVRRHKHHSRKSRSNWALTGAFVASAAFAPSLASPAHATELGRRLELLRIAVPAETLLARALPAQAPRGDERQLRFDIPGAPLRTVLAEIERISGVSIVITDTAIADIWSPGVSGLFTPLEAIARALEGTSVTSRLTGPNRVSVEIRLASEAVDVTGAIPQPASLVAEVRATAHRRAPDDRSHSARGDGGAGCDDAERCLEECSGH